MNAKGKGLDLCHGEIKGVGCLESRELISRNNATQSDLEPMKEQSQERAIRERTVCTSTVD
jgi:hypothetical protein